MNKAQQEELAGRIRKRLDQEPTIADPSKISLRVEQRGLPLKRKTYVVLEGAIGNAEEGGKAETVTNAVIGGNDGVELENHLVVPLI
ncbi:MAG: hypothetical protein PF508_19570 [Spirochaeta sp.]|jgi:hypothetical protein|nr:hypothetical protein [Spirochaeta sp.]